jgi:hypothetical protein
MTTATELIQDALEMLGVYAPGETVTAADSARSLFILNALLDELASQNIFIYQTTQQVALLAPTQATYTIGEVGANVTAPRPQRIAYGDSGASLSSPGLGSGYKVNDTGSVTGGGGTGGTYIITSVAPGGIVSSFNIAAEGADYTTNASAATATGGAQPGSGTGFLISITAAGGAITESALVGSVFGAPVNVVSAIEFQAFAANSPPNGMPDTLNYNPTYPMGTLNVLPAPSAAFTLSFTSWLRLTRFPNLTAPFTFAVGVLDALRITLAVYAKTYFRDAQIDPIIVQAAAMSKDFLRYQSLNSRAMLNRFTLVSNPRKPD